MSTLEISGKAIGSKRPLFADWSLPFPPEWEGEGGLTLRDLIGAWSGKRCRTSASDRTSGRCFAP
jgi:hypothetical protein